MSYQNIKDFRLRRKESIIRCLGGKCNKCNYNKYYGALDLHHIDSKSKLHNIADLLRNPSKVEILIAEAKKCILLCRVCHAELHGKIWNIKDITPANFNESELDWYVLKPDRICVICKIGFKPRTKIQKCCSDKCSRLVNRRVIRPSKEELEKMIWEQPTSHLSKLFGVSSNAIAKWCKSLKINKPPRGYWQKKNKIDY